MPIEEQFLGHLLDGGRAAASAHEEGEALGVQGVVGKPVEPFAFHAPTPRARNPARLEVEIDALVATGEVADATWPLVVDGAEGLSADATEGFFGAGGG